MIRTAAAAERVEVIFVDFEDPFQCFVNFPGKLLCGSFQENLFQPALTHAMQLVNINFQFSGIGGTIGDVQYCLMMLDAWIVQ